MLLNGGEGISVRLPGSRPFRDRCCGAGGQQARKSANGKDSFHHDKDNNNPVPYTRCSEYFCR